MVAERVWSIRAHKVLPSGGSLARSQTYALLHSMTDTPTSRICKTIGIWNIGRQGFYHYAAYRIAKICLCAPSLYLAQGAIGLLARRRTQPANNICIGISTSEVDGSSLLFQRYPHLSLDTSNERWRRLVLATSNCPPNCIQ